MGAAGHSRPHFDRDRISGFVLAGGRSSRLGQDKVLLPWRGQTLLEHALKLLDPICASVRVCGDRSDIQHLFAHSENGPSRLVISDAVKGAGPLSGIVSALEQSRTAWNFFLAVDLPLVPPALLERLALRTPHIRPNGVLCILPSLDGLLQPLCGLYHSSLAPGLRRALQEGKYKITLALALSIQALGDSPGATSFAKPSVEGDQALGDNPGAPSFAKRRVGGDGKQPSAESIPPLFSPDRNVDLPGVEVLDVRKFAASAFVAPPALDPADWFLNINTPEQWQRAQTLCPADFPQE